MKRSVTPLAALVVIFVWIAGCSSGPTPDRKRSRTRSSTSSIGFCAEVDRQLAKIPGGTKAAARDGCRPVRAIRQPGS